MPTEEAAEPHAQLKVAAVHHPVYYQLVRAACNNVPGHHLPCVRTRKSAERVGVLSGQEGDTWYPMQWHVVALLQEHF